MTKRKWLILTIAISLMVIVAGVIGFYKYQQTRYLFPNGPDFNSADCKPGGRYYPCPVIEDEGKIKVSNAPEVQVLAKKYGWSRVHIKALEIELVKHTAFIEKIYPNLAENTGCIIIAHAGDEGYVYREDKNLNIAYQETLAEFMERTKNIDPEYMSKFYLSLH